MARRTEKRTALVIGAGFQGLTVAHALRRRGVAVTVLEAERRVGEPWRRRHPQLRLNTHRLNSNPPGLPFPRSVGSFPDRAAVIAQLDAYAAALDAPIRTGVAIERIDPEAGGWVASTCAGAFRADAVVVATGRARHPHVPEWPGRDDFPGEIRHSEAFGSADDYAGKAVLVAGAGNSAVDLVGHLADVPTGPIHLALRRSVGILPKRLWGFPTQLSAPLLAPLPLAATDAFIRATARIAFGDLRCHGLPAPDEGAASRMARDGTAVAIDDGFVAMLKAGRVAVVPAVARIEGPSVVLADGRTIRPDVIVAATGYRTGLEPLAGHLGVLDAAGVPLAPKAVTRRAPGLWFVGMEPRLVGFFRAGAAEARRIARAVAARRRPPAPVTAGGEAVPAG